MLREAKKKIEMSYSNPQELDAGTAHVLIGKYKQFYYCFSFLR